MKRFSLSILVAFCSLAANAQVVLNELMQSNIDCVMDDLNEFPDSWVELRNTGSEAVDLRSYSIGLTDDATTAWHLPSHRLQPGAYILVYCDKEATGWHTDFRLDSGKGGAVYLFADGKVVDSVKKIPKQPAPNIAYGRSQTTNEWGYPYGPSPLSSNGSLFAEGVLGEPQFSHAGGVFTSGTSLSLSLSLPDDAPEGSLIRYTTDGSEPTKNSASYSKPIAISKTTVVRAKVFCSGWLSPYSTVHSYIVPDHNITLPVVSIATNKEYLQDNKIGILVDGTYDANKKNYQYDWRRPLNLELYEPDGTTCSLNQLCEGRVMGAASRGCALKSLALYANKRFGEKRFNYEFFPDQRPGQRNYKSFLLRNAGNDFDYLYMRDAVIQRTMASHTDIDWQAWRPAVVYINGEYKGILNIRDRSNDDNIFTYYDELEDIDIIKNGWELQHGTWDHYNAFKIFYTEHGHTWDEYAQWIDLDEYINIMAMNLYFGNLDFPGNNIVMWRPRTDDGRWRIIAKDTDYSLGIYDISNAYNMVAWINNADYDGNYSWANQWDHTRLFRRLMEDADFQREFIDRSCIYMGDFLNEKTVRRTWDAMYDLIKDEYPIHRFLYNRWWPNYDDELSKARKWLAGRAEQHYRHLANFYGLGTPQAMTINAGLEAEKRLGIRVAFNGVELSRSEFDGKFFPGRNITLEARPATPDDAERYYQQQMCATGSADEVNAEPLEVVGWRVATVDAKGNRSEQDYQGSTLQMTMPECSSMQFTALTAPTSGIVPVSPSSGEAPSLLYDLQGRPSVGSRPAGIYLQRTGSASKRIILR